MSNALSNGTSSLSSGVSPSSAASQASSNSVNAINPGAFSSSIASPATSNRRMFFYRDAPGNGADNPVTAFSASSATFNGVSTSSRLTASISLQSGRAASGSVQAGSLTNNHISQVSDMSRSTPTHMSIGGDSTLSTSIIPVNASGFSLQADVSSGGTSIERPVQDSEPKFRLAAFKPRSLSSAGDDKQASANPGARPAATKGQA